MMANNPRRYGFKEKLDELSAIVHYAAHHDLTKRQLDPVELFIQARSRCPAALNCPAGA
jgi:hypothetical protein